MAVKLLFAKDLFIKIAEVENRGIRQALLKEITARVLLKQIVDVCLGRSLVAARLNVQQLMLQNEKNIRAIARSLLNWARNESSLGE